MNISPILGLGLGIVAIGYAATHGIKNQDIFLSMHAALIVIGGTLAAGLICFPMKHFFNLFFVFFGTLTGRRRAQMVETINEIVKLSEQVNDGANLQNSIGTVRNPFLKESIQLMVEGGLSTEELEEVLEKRVELQNEKYKRDGMTFKIIGKFPPAFGLVGATMGMIALLQGLGEPDAFDRLGPSMSVALVATFYGLVLANVFLIPMGENLSQASDDDLLVRRIVVDGVRLLRDQKHPLLVEEYLKSYLSPDDRKGMKRTATA